MPKPKLQFVGSCRNNSNEERLQMLKEKEIELNVDKQVEFYKNVTYRLADMDLFHYIWHTGGNFFPPIYYYYYGVF